VLTQSHPRALLGPVPNATDVMGVLEADDCNAVLLGPLDADIHRFLGDHLAVARAAIDRDHRAIVANDLCMLVTDTMPRSSVLYISGHHAHAVAVMAEEIGQHQVIGHQPGLLVRAAIGPADRHREGVQRIGHHPYFAHATRTAGHTRLPPTGTNRAGNSAVGGAKSIPPLSGGPYTMAFDPFARRPFLVADLGPDVDPFILVFAALTQKECTLISKRTTEASAKARGVTLATQR
jgi:hypothetical protein